MSTSKFRIGIVLVGALIMILGTRVLAQTCGTGCNFGSLDHCYGVSGESPCGSEQTCEQDYCTVIGCAYNNLYTFCVNPDFLCHLPSCSWDVGCGCSNG
jgi:hypothetical protein